jgi:uncharacterized repeat protein (TIGR03803 family)
MQGSRIQNTRIDNCQPVLILTLLPHSCSLLRPNNKENSVKNHRTLKVACLATAFCIATAISSPAQTFKTLVNFDVTNGGTPFAGLVQGTDGNFYGTTAYGGTNYTCSFMPRTACGTVFKMTSDGTLTTLHSFNDASDAGYDPQAALLQAANGAFYGATMQGGPDGLGSIFRVTSGGTLIPLYTYTSTNNGAYPDAALVHGSGGNLYGTTRNGGVNGDGTVFKIVAGTLTVLRRFDNNDGGLPYGLVHATDGNFYGVTNEGGANTRGTIYKITPAGTLTTLHNFHFQDGGLPDGTLLQGANGILYGTTQVGGKNGTGTVFSLDVGLGHDTTEAAPMQ